MHSNVFILYKGHWKISTDLNFSWLSDIVNRKIELFEPDMLKILFQKIF